jgi:hypothetical protein
MMQSQPQVNSLFQTSLLDWRERWKARQAEQPAQEQAPARGKRIVARKRRKAK